MTDQPSTPRFLGRDTGTHRETIGRDRAIRTRPSFTCNATCPCGTRIDALTLGELRDRCACHLRDCDGVQDG